MYSSLDIYNQPVTLAPTTVASPNSAYQRMANFWALIEDLKEGTYKIRSEHRKYLQQEPRETKRVINILVMLVKEKKNL